MILTGYTHRIAVDISSDQIIAPEYAASGDPAELAGHCLEQIAPSFASDAREGDILVVSASISSAGDPESAVLALQAVGIAAIVCHEADQIFIEQAHSYGLPVLKQSAAAHALQSGILLRIDLQRGLIEEPSSRQRWQSDPAEDQLLSSAQRSQLLGRMRRVVEEEGFGE
jgi:3-isopropylmalate/(R)-2-methylmalate dehydratase small subunit